MNVIEKLLQDAGWSTLFRKNQVSVEHPKYGLYKVCDKYFGGTYEDELKQAYAYLLSNNLIECLVQARAS
jgi:hypothetical protein